jgi:hypothetical protein
MKLFFYFIVIIFCFGAMSCKGKPNPADFDQDLTHCPQKPNAFFAPTMRSVKAHQFSLSATKSTERIAFENGTALEIIQSGCAKINQQFVFNLPGDFEKEKAADSAIFWTETAIQQFNTLAQLDPKLGGLAMWSQALNAVKADLKVQEPLQLEPHRFISLDRIVSAGGALLIVTLSED